MSIKSEGSLEIEIASGSGYSNAGDTALVKAREAFDALQTLLTDALQPFRQRMETVADSVDELELQMVLALKGEGKWVVVSMGASASMSVRVLWKKKGS